MIKIKYRVPDRTDPKTIVSKVNTLAGHIEAALTEMDTGSADGFAYTNNAINIMASAINQLLNTVHISREVNEDLNYDYFRYDEPSGALFFETAEGKTYELTITEIV